MAQKRICIQIDFNGPNPLIINTNGTFDKRTSLVNLARLLRGIDHGSQLRGQSSSLPYGPPSVVVQSSVVQASATATPVGVILDDTLTIGGTALTAKKGRASSTCTCATVVAADTVTVNGVTFTAVNGAVVLGEATFDCSGNDTATATSIAAQFNAYVDPRISGLIAARSAAAVVTFYAQAIGTGGNSYTLTSSSNTTLAVTGSGFLAGGAALTNNQFDYNGTDITTGADIVRCIGASTSAAIKAVNATYSTSTGVVTVTAKAPGVAGNAVTFTSSSNTRLAVTGSGFLASGSAGAPTQWTF